jgi:hypothetical protein
MNFDDMIGGGNSEQTKPSFGFGGMSFPSN